MTITELDELLVRLGRQRFTEHAFRVDHHGPDILAFVRDWGAGTADVVILFDERVAWAYRTATGPDIDVFAPELVSWWYGSCPVWTLRAVITLPGPGHPEAPNQLLNPPPGYGLPKTGRMPVRVRMRNG
ncbi:MAG TPA: hypothetical protein VFV67_10630 [Actinophytocola sp.]|uniref:hypothetical protein n=1 Tax=Actinophytocola sp. TaxID=1872138 RepID=UPI002DB7CF29|nr:hypothetical protein [Actinophytocola sp.]HEU5471099.1 hypothetical protein [Actinophytocola sp.]